MNRLVKRTIAVFMTVLLLTATLPLTGFAANDFLSNIEYEVYEDGGAVITYCDAEVSGSVTIPDTIDGYPVVGLDHYSFSWCDKITEITFGKNVAFIGSFTFAYTDSLKKFNVDPKNPYLSTDANGVLYNKDKTELVQYPVGNPSKSFTVPSSVKSIVEEAFFSTVYLEEVSIPASVESIGAIAFSVTLNLKNIKVDPKNSFYCDVDGVLFDKSKAELICYPAGRDFAEYNVPDGVKTVGDYAFYGSRLNSITFPQGLESIGISAFEDFGGVNTILIPESTKMIGEYAFYNSDVNAVTLKNKNVVIGERAFGYKFDYEVEEEYTISHFTLYGEENSTAKTYAEENGFKFEQLRLPGDINGDGKVDSSDALLVLQYSVGSAELSEAQLASADVCKDDVINSNDSLYILQYIVGTKSEL